jgi:hypothetical protein
MPSDRAVLDVAADSDTARRRNLLLSNARLRQDQGNENRTEYRRIS